MNQQSAVPGRPPWTFGPLYDLFLETFPGYRTPRGVFDMPRLAADLRMTTEGCYKWFRKNRLQPVNVKAVVELANSRGNVADLKALGKEPPTREQFLPFVLL